HANMASDKNGGPNFLQAWREFREMTQEELAKAVGTTGAVISLLESSERGLSAKWLRRLAPPLKTRPGILLDCHPDDLDTEFLRSYEEADPKMKRRIAKVVSSIMEDDADAA